MTDTEWDKGHVTINAAIPAAGRVMIMAAWFAEGWVPIGSEKNMATMQIRIYGKRRKSWSWRGGR